MASKRHLKIKTVEEKCKVLKDSEYSMSNKDVSEKKYRATKSTFYVLKNKEKFLSDLEMSSTNLKRKRMLIGGYEGVDEAIFQWLLAKRSHNVPTDGALWKEKLWIPNSKQLDPPDFKTSDCWLSNLKTRLVSYIQKLQINFPK